MSDKKIPLWVSEFGAMYRPDRVVLNLLKDARVSDDSWHNDVAPHFSADAGANWNVEIWFEHPDRNLRENGRDVKRYLVTISNREDSGIMVPEPVSTYTNDAREAVKAFRRLMLRAQTKND